MLLYGRLAPRGKEHLRVKHYPMNALERRALALLAAVYALRMAGLFLILPVFALYADGLEGHAPWLVGLALGAYGLTQALLQIPFGMLSDRLGRKPVIAAGLLIFAAGSFLAAAATDIYWVIAGRALQGAGAIAAAVMAFVADLTRDEVRTKAMAVVGMTIGASFVASLILGPVLDGLIGVSGIFALTGILALAAIVLVLAAVPTPVRPSPRRSAAVRREFAAIVRDRDLLRLDLGVFVLHLAMTALFVVLPPAIVHAWGLEASAHWKLYLPTMVAGFAAMLPWLLVVNRRGYNRPVMAGAVALLTAAQLVFFLGHTTAAALVVGLWLFFACFSLLEAMLPSLVSRLAPPASKGAAIGVYSTSQFFGAFAGGALGGVVSGSFGSGGVFLLIAAVLLVWLLAVATMPEPRLLTTRELPVGVRTPLQAERLARRLAAIPGVHEAVVIAEQGVAYLKVDSHRLDRAALERLADSA
jgi:MFS family permease